MLVSPEPRPAGIVAIGDAAVSVLVVGSVPVFVSVSTVTATISWVMDSSGIPGWSSARAASVPTAGMAVMMTSTSAC